MKGWLPIFEEWYVFSHAVISWSPDLSWLYLDLTKTSEELSRIILGMEEVTDGS